MTHALVVLFGNRFNILALIVIIIVLAFLISHCSDKGSPGTKKEKVKYDIKYYSKRRWCPIPKQFQYLSPIEQTKEELMHNYYKVYNLKGQIAKEEVYKDIDTPHGSWFYYDDKKRLIKEAVYSEGRQAEEFVFAFDKEGNKKEEAHYVWSPDKKLRVKSLYFYNEAKETGKKILGKIEHYNAGILDEYIKFEYDKKARLRKKSVFLYVGHLKSYNLYSYDKDGKLLKEETYNRENKIIQIINYKYAKKKGDLRIKEKNILRRNDLDKMLLTNTIVYLSNSLGLRLKKTEHTRSNSGRMIKAYEFRYFYDPAGCKEKEERFDGNGSLVETIKY